MARIVIVPGLHNSGPEHWQSWLESHTDFSSRIEMADWTLPDLRGWTQAILETVDRTENGAIVVAHSFGCLAAIRAAYRLSRSIRGLLLVAPADPVKFQLDRRTFAQPLPMRAVLVGSENDPWMGCWAARELADGLGADFLNLGRAGHINVESGHGPWPGALRLIDGLERPLVRTFRPDAPGKTTPR